MGMVHESITRVVRADHVQFLLQEKGLIYEKKHEGWYSITDEAFYPQSAVKPYLDPPTGRKLMVSIETGSEVEWSSETNYHFRLSVFRDKLLEFYKANPTWITPEHRMQEVIQAVESGLEDLSISRPYERLSWGIRVPGDDTQTIYVWLDALVNYITKAGYPWTPGRETAGGWPADCHVIGKDIVRFHCVYWPAFLMALGLPLPKKILSHAHWTLGGSKMSKSTGRVVDPFHAIGRFGPDVMRFYMCRDGGIQNDSSYDNAHIISLYQNFLNGQLGNLATRVMRNKKWSVAGAVKRVGGRTLEEWAEGPGAKFWNRSLSKITPSVEESFEAYDPRTAVHLICDLVHRMSKPWEKTLTFSPGEPGEEVDKIVYETTEALRMTGILLQPWMPNKASLLLDQLGATATMAFNSWDKLAKAQNDYPKPKFALAVVDKALKKQANNPYLLAIMQQNKEAIPDKKQSHYSLILATQLAAEQKISRGGPETRMGEVQQSVALKLMKQAFTAAPGDQIAVSNVRDLRFMASIFGRQRRSTELHDLWGNPPERLQPVFDRHRQDLLMVEIKLLREGSEWGLLEDRCTSTIAETVENLRLVGGSKTGFWELSAWRWEIWDALLASMRHRSVLDARQIIHSQMSLCFGDKLEAKDRPLQLTYMKLRQYTGDLTLADCKDYFQQHSGLNSCFDDLRPFVASLWRQEVVQFLDFLYESLVADTGTPNMELNHKSIHQMFHFALQALIIAPDNADLGAIVVYTLLNIHHRMICTDDLRNPIVTKVNCRVLLQATMLARHLVEKDKDKQNRTFALLAARLHLNLGLGTVAFRLFRHTKCKEMLVDTLSPYMLSRISQTHPFDVKGYGGFSADDELAKVVGTIERMERKTNDYLFTDTSSFLWDQATDTRELKRKLRSSLTKHLSVFERRRIARLRGESVESLPKLKAKEFYQVSDNVDRTIFPNFERTDLDHRASQYIMPTEVPNMQWIVGMYWSEERAMKLLWGEEAVGSHDTLEHSEAVLKMKSSRNSTPSCSEHMTLDLWCALSKLTFLICEHPDTKSPQLPDGILELPNMLFTARKIIEDHRMPGDTTLKPEDDITMFHENLLMSCYGWLSCIRAVHKLTEVLQERILKKKGPTHPLLAKFPVLKDLHTRLSEESKVCYQAVRDMAQSYMNLIKSKGLVAIKAQVRWGYTGKDLERIMSDDDVEYYAKEYVESALEAWNGVLKVKLK
ncbi:tRNA synthetases class I (M)-domain-containing protein [Phaeosphaeria sp. MPI-PUGE-AT-0046c]|nr:tRNA synthetases class I (M)-domain-containing protein [Phaeosphaeria sp. MPI-PUGE-AT-0046c]